KHFEIIMIAIVFVSLLPAIIVVLKRVLRSRKEA
ncbi:MAG: cytochrome O ubiquinol oxidase, partial [Lactococcus lactis]|nr:cytochrome O ubiquinol oxidase [Lactococcus lactis]